MMFRMFLFVVLGFFVSVPVQAGKIVAGIFHTCSVLNGSVECWGLNDTGQLGNNTTTDSTLPVQVTTLDSGVTSVAVGQAHTCAVKNGAAYCWGNNSYYQLGNNSQTSSSVPVPLNQPMISGVTSVAAGQLHSCAIQNGGAWCWGSSPLGALGTNSATNITPHPIFSMLHCVIAIAAKAQNTCAIQIGAAYCWGDNTSGQLGNGTTGGIGTSPVAVTGLSSGVTAISV